MVLAIEHALELMIAILSNRLPNIGWSTIELKFFSQHAVGIERNIGSQLIVLILGQVTIGIRQLSQITQLGTIVDDVWIVLRTRSAGENDRSLTVPYFTGTTMRRVFRCLPAAVLTYLHQARDIRIVTQHILERLAHTGCKVGSVHLNGVLAAEVCRLAESFSEIFIAIYILHIVCIITAHGRSALHCREAVLHRTAISHCPDDATLVSTINLSTGVAVFYATLCS